MIRKTFDKELATLNKRLIEMGNSCVEGIDLALEILFKKGNSEEILKQLHEIEKETDRKERDIEDLCMKLILRQQPVARDLRMISAALRMIADMERIGDQVADIGDLSIGVDGKALAVDTHIKELAVETKSMVINSVEAYVNRDAKLADQVILNDDKVDQMFINLKDELLRIMYKDIAMGQNSLDILMIAKYFERIGDHAVNIAESVEYAFN